MTAPIVGQDVIVKIQSSPLREVPAKVSLVIDTDTINAIAFSDINDDWPGDGPAVPYASRGYWGITRGSGVNQWRDADVPPPIQDAIDSAGYATESYVDNAQANCQALPAAGTSQVSLGLNAARRPSTTRPVKVTGTGQITLTSTLLGGKTATVALLSDSSNPPTTSRGQAKFDLSGVAATVGPPWALEYEVPIGHYYMFATSGADAAGVSLATITEQVT